MRDEDPSWEQLLSEVARLHQGIAAHQASSREPEEMGEGLHESEQRLRSLIEQSEDGIVLIDGQGTVVEWNPGQERITGIGRAEAVGRPVWDIQFQVASEEKKTTAVYVGIKVRVLDLLRTGQAPWMRQFVEQEIRCPDGTRRVIRSMVLPISTPNGWMAGSICRDITEHPSGKQERKRVEEASQRFQNQVETRVQRRTVELATADEPAKQETAERRRAEEEPARERDNPASILDAMEDGVHIIDQDHEIEYANPSLRERFGPCEGKKCYQYLHGRDDICPWCPDQRILAGETVRREQYCAKDQRTYDLVDTPVKRAGGRVSKLQIMRDVTQRKQMEDTLRQSEARWHSLVKNAPDVILTVDREGRILFINRTPAGMTVEDVVRTNIGDYVPAKTRATAVHSIRRVCQTGQAEYCEIAARGPYGSTSWYATRLGPIKRDGEVVAVMLVARDITRRRREEDELRRTRNELEARVYERTAELLQANAQLEQEIAERKRVEDEILVYQDQLRSLGSELLLTEERERRRIATDLHDQIGQTLALCRIRLGTLREAATTPEIADALDEMRAMMVTAVAYTRSLTYQLSPPILYELGLEAAVEWLCEDLLERHGAMCTLEVDQNPKPLDDDVRVLLYRAVREVFVNIAKHAQAHSAKVSIRSDAQDILIVVKDDGVGFDASKTFARSREGLGFGLFLYHERLNHLGGRFQVESSPGRGTVVSLAAPLKRDQEARGGR